MITVDYINRVHCNEWILKKHYAHRLPSITHAFGLFVDSFLMGIITYGHPPSTSLRKGIAGKKWMDIVIELNRLVINDNCPKNSASILVGHSLKKLNKPTIVVSFADTSQNHVGYIYQATNFIYTGLSAKRKNWKIKGKENKHSFTIADESRGQKNRAKWMRKKYGNDFYLEDRPRKHRYIYIVANKKDKKQILQDMKYKQQPYPKGKNKKYDASYRPMVQMGLFK